MRGFSQTVALKLIQGTLVSGAVRERFDRERRILAGLHHPCIAQMLDGGNTQEGQPYFTMEYVDGLPVTTYCERHGLDLGQRLDLVLRVASALAYAHQNLVIHRDVKPSNVMVSGEGEVKLLDFGISKLINETAGETLTRHHMAPMTPEYAAPEQFRRGAITVATDVYQLGVLMYRLITGGLPYQADPEDTLAWAKAVCEEDPLSLRRGSGRGTSSSGPQAGSSSLATGTIRVTGWLDGDLNAIVHKALAKSPDARYRSMDALIADLEAYRDCRPVVARNAGGWYRTRRFLRRHRTVAIISATAVLLIGLTAAIAVLQAIAAAKEAKNARVEADNARQITSFVTNLFKVSDPGENRGDKLSANDILERGAQVLEADTQDNPLRAGQLAFVVGRVYASMGEDRRAVKLFERAEQLLRQGRGSDVERGRNFVYYAGAVKDLGHLEEALGLAKQAEELTRGIQTQEAKLVYNASVGTSAQIFARLGKLEEAVQMYRASLAGVLMLDNPLPGAVSAIEISLSEALVWLGKRDEAVAMARQSLLDHRKAFAAEELDSLIAMSGLSDALAVNARHEEAEALSLEAREIAKRVYGEKAEVYAGTLTSAAMAYYYSQEFDRSLASARSAIAIFTAEDSTYVRNYFEASLIELKSLVQLGRFAEAMASGRAALASIPADFATNDVTVLQMRANLAAARLASGDVEGARAELEPALSEKLPMHPPAALEVFSVSAMIDRGSPERIDGPARAQRSAKSAIAAFEAIASASTPNFEELLRVKAMRDIAAQAKDPD